MFIDRLNEGGPFFMYPLFLILILLIILIVKGFLQKGPHKKTKPLPKTINVKG